MTTTRGLTRASKKLLRAMYKEYKKRIKNGVEIDRARYFGNVQILKGILGLEESVSDINVYCKELTEHGFVQSIPENDSRFWICLKPLGVAVMERIWLFR